MPRDGNKEWLKPTHCIQVVKHLMHANDLVIQFIVTVRIWEESVTVRYEQIENVHHLQSSLLQWIYTVTKKHTQSANL